MKVSKSDMIRMLLLLVKLRWGMLVPDDVREAASVLIGWLEREASNVVQKAAKK